MYNVNVKEYANCVVKRSIKLEKLGVQDCVTHIQNIVQRQYVEAGLSVLGSGEYSISDLCKNTNLMKKILLNNKTTKDPTGKQIC